MSLLAQMGMMMGKAGGEKPPAYDEWTIHSNGEPQTSLIQSFGSIPDGYAVVCFAYKSDLKPTFTIELNGNPLEIHDTHEVDAQIGAVVAYTDAQFSDSDPNILDIQSDEPFFNVYGRLLPIDYLPDEVWRASDNGTGSSAVLGTELADIFGAVAIDEIQERKPETTPIATHYWGVGKTGTDIPLDVPVIPAGSAWSYSSGEYSRIDQGAMSETLELSFSVPTAGEIAINLDYRPSVNAELYVELVDSALAKTKRLVMAVGNSQLLMGKPTKTYTRLNLIGKGELTVSVATQEPISTTVGGIQRGEDEQIQLLQESPNYFSFAAIGLKQARDLWTPADMPSAKAAFAGDGIVSAGGAVSEWQSEIGDIALTKRGAVVTLAASAYGDAPAVNFLTGTLESAQTAALQIFQKCRAGWYLIVYKQNALDTGSVNRPLFRSYAGTSSSRADFYVSYGSAINAPEAGGRRLDGGSYVGAKRPTPFTAANWHIDLTKLHFDGGKAIYDNDGGSLIVESATNFAAGETSDTPSSLPLTVGGDQSPFFSNCQIAAVVIGSGEVMPSAEDFARLQGWAAWLGGAVGTAILPPAHPYKTHPPYK